MEYHKLVRDRIPERIEKKNERVVFHIATEEEYTQKLKEKLSEEVGEYLSEASPEELADILEVVYALGELHDTSPRMLEELRIRKVTERGGFTKKIILDEA